MNTDMIDAALIQTVVRTIVERFDPHRIVLFGSRARGEAQPESDLDLLVEMETELPPLERAVAVSALFGLRPWPLDVLVFTPAEAERLRNVRGSFLAMIDAEGQVLYERP
jgi:predicted nucleotidyltransferase